MLYESQFLLIDAFDPFFIYYSDIGYAYYCKFIILNIINLPLSESCFIKEEK